jgi:hypothetical protein
MQYIPPRGLQRKQKMRYKPLYHVSKKNIRECLYRESPYIAALYDTIKVE